MDGSALVSTGDAGEHSDIPTWLQELGAPAWLLTIAGIITVVLIVLDRLSGSKLATAIFSAARSRIWRTRSAERDASRLFARHVKSQIELLNLQDQWSDRRFAELEAEIEVDRSMLTRWIFSIRSTQIRRIHSLSRAIRTTSSRLTVLTGEPGSGKSIALRHAALMIARRASRGIRRERTVPIYLNLRDLKVPSDAKIDAGIIRDFALKCFDEAGVPAAAEYFRKHFDRRLKEGSWLFFLDSFDEIPGILSSVEEDSQVRLYRDAIYSFVHGFSECKAVLASRDFRGPAQYGLPTFTIVPLSDERINRLVKLAKLNRQTRKSILDRLLIADGGFSLMARNPLFLSLLCDYLREGGPFAISTHEIFEEYVASRLSRDSVALASRYGLPTYELWTVAEQVAFCLAVTPLLGLAPTPRDLDMAMARLDFVSGEELSLGLAALRHVQILRRASAGGSEDDQATAVVGFAHRRFQEYFATRLVLRSPNLVAPRALLQDGRWRETAVTVLQSQPESSLRPLLSSADRLLNSYRRKMLRIVQQVRPESGRNEIEWPPGLFHLLQILDEGLGASKQDSGAKVRQKVDTILSLIWEAGLLPDRRSGLSVLRASSRQTQIELLLRAFGSESVWLQKEAYRQAGRADIDTEPVTAAMRRVLIRSSGLSLLRNRKELRAQLRRLSHPTPLLACLNLLTVRPLIDYALFCVGLLVPWLFAVRHLQGTSKAIGVGVLAGMLVMAFVMLGFSESIFRSLEDRRSPTAARNFLDGAIYVSARGVIVLLGISFWSEVGGPTAAKWPLALVVLGYLSFWPLSSYLAARDGVMLRAWEWPAQPIHLFRSALRSASRLRRGIGYYWSPRQLLKLIGWAILMLAFVALALWAASKYNEIAESPSPGWPAYTILAFILAFTLIAVPAVLKGWLASLSFALSVRRIRAGSSAERVIELACSAPVPYKFLDTLQRVRSRRLLATSESNLRVLLDLLKVLERHADNSSGWKELIVVQREELGLTRIDQRPSRVRSWPKLSNRSVSDHVMIPFATIDAVADWTNEMKQRLDDVAS